MEKTKRKFEYTIFTIITFLSVFGLIMLYSASYIYAGKTYGLDSYLVVKQGIFFLIGFILCLIISMIPYKLYMPFVHYIFIGCLVLVIVTTFAGRISRGSSRWIELHGLIFQPSELMKLAMILDMSKILTKNMNRLDERDAFVKVMAIAYIPTFIIALTNLSTGIILFLIATSMIFLASKKKLIFIYILTLIIIVYVFSYPISKILYNVGILKQYQIGRIFAWKEPENYRDIAYQTLQGLYAIGSGGYAGRGYMNSIQKSLIPEAQNDMIFTIICEELGFVGAILFVILYLLLVYRIFFISLKEKRVAAKFISFGIGIHIAVQVILNIGVVTNLLPNTGVTLPLVSYGGSSLLVSFIEFGILMSIVRYS